VPVGAVDMVAGCEISVELVYHCLLPLFALCDGHVAVPYVWTLEWKILCCYDKGVHLLERSMMDMPT